MSDEIEFDSGLIDDMTDELGDWEVPAGTEGQSTTGRYSTAWYTVIAEVRALMVTVASLGVWLGRGQLSVYN